MDIKGLQKVTLLDFPDRVACTIFTGGCNFRCPFCQNTDLVLRAGSVESIPEQEIFSYLKKRQGLIDGICISGGEPTMQPDLRDFIIECRKLGYAVKLDTNGFMPDILSGLISDGLIDYVAMDIKTCIENYALVSGIRNIDISRIERSVEILKCSGIVYEFRTTVVHELHSADDFFKIGEWLKGVPHYFLQRFVDSGDILEEGLSAESNDVMHEYLEIVKRFIPNAELRGI